MEKETNTEVGVDELPPQVGELAEDQTIVDAAESTDAQFSEDVTDAIELVVESEDSVEQMADDDSTNTMFESGDASGDGQTETGDTQGNAIEAAQETEESMEEVGGDEDQTESKQDGDADQQDDSKSQKAPPKVAAAEPEAITYTEPELKAAIETVFFAADDPVLHKDLRKLFPGLTKAVLDRAIAQISLDYSGEYKGIHLMEIAGGYQFRTNPAYNDVLIRLFEAKPIRISKPAMETLAIVSYRQPVAKSEVDEIRGVDCSGTLRKLLEFDLVMVVGKADDIGRPNLYGTTHRFLEFFGLDSLTELPTLEKFEIDALELVGENLKDFLPEDEAPILDDDMKDGSIRESSGDAEDSNASTDGESPAGFVSAATGANDDGVETLASGAEAESDTEHAESNPDSDSEDPTEASIDDSEE